MEPATNTEPSKYNGHVYDSGDGFLMLFKLNEILPTGGYLSEIDRIYCQNFSIKYDCNSSKILSTNEMKENTLYIQEFVAYNNMKPFGDYNGNVYDMYFKENGDYYKLAVVFPDIKEFEQYYEICMKAKSFLKPFHFMYIL